MIPVYISSIPALRSLCRRFSDSAIYAILAILCACSAMGDELRHRQLTAEDGIPLNLVVAGRTEGPAIVFLHGFSQSYMSWLSQLGDPRLLDAYRLVALDLRGHGGSGKPWTPDAYLDPERWADDINLVITELGLESPLLVGWSFGGYVLLDYVRVYGTQSLSGLMLIGSHGGLLPISPGSLGISNGDLKAQLRDARAFISRMSLEPLSPAVREQGVASFMMLPDYARRAMTGKNRDNTDLVAGLKVPVQFLLGSEEPFIDHGLVRRLASEMPCARQVYLENVGHMPFAENPARFGELLLEFAGAVRHDGNPKPDQLCAHP